MDKNGVSGEVEVKTREQMARELHAGEGDPYDAVVTDPFPYGLLPSTYSLHVRWAFATVPD
jgi:hypothetical protein